MARGRLSPWPSYVDLFSALLLLTFGMIATVGRRTDGCPGLLATCEAQLEALRKQNRNLTDQLSKCRAECTDEAKSEAKKLADQLKRQVEKAVKTAGGVDIDQESTTEDEVGFNVSLAFNLNKADTAQFSPAEVAKLKKVADALRQNLDEELLSLPGHTKKEVVQIVVEGHSDQSQLSQYSPAEARFRYNWDLSAQRASAVLFQLHKLGLSSKSESGKTGFNIASWGRADSLPLCSDSSTACSIRNRRATIRVKFDYLAWKRLRSEAEKAGVLQ